MTKHAHEEVEATTAHGKKHPHEEEATSTHAKGKAEKAEATPDDAVAGTKGELNRLATHLKSCQVAQEAALVAMHDDAEKIVEADKDQAKVLPLANHLNGLHTALLGVSSAVAAACETLIAAETALKTALAAK